MNREVPSSTDVQLKGSDDLELASSYPFHKEPLAIVKSRHGQLKPLRDISSVTTERRHISTRNKGGAHVSGGLNRRNIFTKNTALVMCVNSASAHLWSDLQTESTSRNEHDRQSSACLPDDPAMTKIAVFRTLQGSRHDRAVDSPIEELTLDQSMEMLYNHHPDNVRHAVCVIHVFLTHARTPAGLFCLSTGYILLKRWRVAKAFIKRYIFRRRYYLQSILSSWNRHLTVTQSAPSDRSKEVHPPWPRSSLPPHSSLVTACLLHPVGQMACVVGLWKERFSIQKTLWKEGYRKQTTRLKATSSRMWKKKPWSLAYHIQSSHAGNPHEIPFVPEEMSSERHEFSSRDVLYLTYQSISSDAMEHPEYLIALPLFQQLSDRYRAWLTSLYVTGQARPTHQFSADLVSQNTAKRLDPCTHNVRAWSYTLDAVPENVMTRLNISTGSTSSSVDETSPCETNSVQRVLVEYPVPPWYLNLRSYDLIALSTLASGDFKPSASLDHSLLLQDSDFTRGGNSSPTIARNTRKLLPSLKKSLHSNLASRNDEETFKQLPSRNETGPSTIERIGTATASSPVASNTRQLPLPSLPSSPTIRRRSINNNAHTSKVNLRETRSLSRNSKSGNTTRNSISPHRPIYLSMNRIHLNRGHPQPQVVAEHGQAGSHKDHSRAHIWLPEFTSSVGHLHPESMAKESDTAQNQIALRTGKRELEPLQTREQPHPQQEKKK